MYSCGFFNHSFLGISASHVKFTLIAFIALMRVKYPERAYSL